MEVILLLVSLFSVFILPSILITLIYKGDARAEDDDFWVQYIPIISLLCLPFAIIYSINRAIKSKGKCILGHSHYVVYDSEVEKWKNGRRPLRISIGGSTKYKCKKCDDKVYNRWSCGVF